LKSRVVWEMQLKLWVVDFYLKLINVWKPIVKKYSAGKVKRTLKKDLKVFKLVIEAFFKKGHKVIGYRYIYLAFFYS